MGLSHWVNYTDNEVQHNFNDWNYEPVNLGSSEVAWKFKKFNLEELVNKPSNVWPVPNVIYVTTEGWNIYAVYETWVFASKNVWIYSLDSAKQSEILNADLIVLNSRSRKIHPIDISSSDRVVQEGMSFEFTSLGVKSNSSNILEIVGDSWSRSGAVSGQVNNIKKRLVDNIKQ